MNSNSKVGEIQLGEIGRGSKTFRRLLKGTVCEVWTTKPTPKLEWDTGEGRQGGEGGGMNLKTDSWEVFQVKIPN